MECHNIINGQYNLFLLYTDKASDNNNTRRKRNKTNVHHLGPGVEETREEEGLIPKAKSFPGFRRPLMMREEVEKRERFLWPYESRRATKKVDHAPYFKKNEVQSCTPCTHFFRCALAA